MIAYIVRRLVAAVALLFVVSLITFSIFYLVPRLLGTSAEGLASRYVGRNVTEETVQATAERLGFNDPFYKQYGNWVKGVVAGQDFDYGTGVEHCPAPCLGYSFLTREPVLPQMLDRMPVTFSLAFGAAVIWLTFGIGIGVLSALRRGSWFDRATMTVALAGVSLPIFWTGLMSLAFLTYKWGITPSSGYVPLTEDPVSWFTHLILPWVTLAFLFSAQYARLTRSGMLETMNEDYIRTARAKGLPERTVVTRHGLRAALTPLLTIFGLDFGLLIGGAVLTETTFGLPGLGQYAIQGIQGNDLPKILGVTLFAAVFVIIANLVVDILYAVVDPRVRLG